MDNMQIYWLAEISACNARVAGMQSENALRAARGDCPAHPDTDFYAEAATLEQIANAARNYP